MNSLKGLLLTANLLIAGIAGNGYCETFHLGEGEKWVAVDKQQYDYQLAVTKIKDMINKGDVDMAKLAVAELKGEYPELASDDFDAFMCAELIFASGDWRKAATSYEEFVTEYPDSWLYQAALERQFEIASAFLGGQKVKVMKVLKMRVYEDGEDMMHKVSARAGESDLARRALIRLAESYEDRGEYLDAYDVWAQMYGRWPTGEPGRVSLLGMARSMHLAYGGPKYQADTLASASGYYGRYALVYPKESELQCVASVQEQINEQLAYKQLETGKYYHRTGSYVAACVYYQYVMDNWPDTTAADIAQHRMDILKADREELAKNPPKERKGMARFLDLFDLPKFLLSGK